ncbi:ATP-grasp fold amidoligase family protein [Butyrivibrio sp. YAB3001]|uniref:ATP-grasp fold amidoligase family protein n=1 Tax=Butyrivibrio sp. YAB3001 TaxID=1520812 RepID=UPI0008F62023|nr:ATP-grasp fold amidoligase family protein [Butyrivibrio sp. YAB3001]SFB88815.1 TupA-like ATPgrasp [Butyrivibrio sp. YAB3001]
MKIKEKVMEAIKRPQMIWVYLSNRGLFNYMDDEKYLSIRYKCLLGRTLNIKTPLSFNEKLQWLKIHDRKQIYETMVDKYAAKGFVSERIGKEYIIPTYGVWDCFDDINFAELPNEFVIKCTHDSGGVVIVKDKNSTNIKKIKSKINKSLKKNFYLYGREWPYKNVMPRIIIEKYIWNSMCGDKDIDYPGLIDYKFYCFNGIPKFLYVSSGMDKHDTAAISFVSLDWKRLPFYRLDYKQLTELPPQPKCFEKMLKICKKLAEGTNFLRVDLYEVDNKVFFSEMTFYPCSGFMPFNDYKYDIQIGEYLSL